jgi:hypothetical protein
MHDVSRKVLSQLKTVRAEAVNGMKQKSKQTHRISRQEKLQSTKKI